MASTLLLSLSLNGTALTTVSLPPPPSASDDSHLHFRRRRSSFPSCLLARDMPRTNDDDDAYQVARSSAEDKRGNSLGMAATMQLY